MNEKKKINDIVGRTINISGEEFYLCWNCNRLSPADTRVNKVCLVCGIEINQEANKEQGFDNDRSN